MSDEPAIGSDGGLVRLRLDIAYDGTDFAGWAVQGEHRTVAGVLDDAFTTVFRAPVRLFGAGRTDTGVHATGQVAHVDAARGTGVSSAGASSGTFPARRRQGARNHPCTSGI
jgi:hypothetical protein